jgi:phage recombination protein Bet
MRPPTSRTELTPIVSLPSLYNPRDLALIRRTVAVDTTDDEFALFIHWARSMRLDPLRRQVHAFIFHKQDPKKRRLSLVTSIEGFRAIAARTGNYRPDENEPGFIIDDALKSDTNPAGLVSCSVRVWQYAHGQWFPITGVARWDEFAPLKVVWVDNQPTDRKALDKSGRWADMPFLMLGPFTQRYVMRHRSPQNLGSALGAQSCQLRRPSANLWRPSEGPDEHRWSKGTSGRNSIPQIRR